MVNMGKEIDWPLALRKRTEVCLRSLGNSNALINLIHHGVNLYHRSTRLFRWHCLGSAREKTRRICHPGDSHRTTINFTNEHWQLYSIDSVMPEPSQHLERLPLNKVKLDSRRPDHQDAYSTPLLRQAGNLILVKIGWKIRTQTRIIGQPRSLSYLVSIVWVTKLNRLLVSFQYFMTLQRIRSPIKPDRVCPKLKVKYFLVKEREFLTRKRARKAY